MASKTAAVPKTAYDVGGVHGENVQKTDKSCILLSGLRQHSLTEIVVLVP